MDSHSRDEVEDAFRNYWRIGAVGEDWNAWADLFTEDAVYTEHVLGNMRGSAEIKKWITSIMAAPPPPSARSPTTRPARHRPTATRGRGPPAAPRLRPSARAL